MRAVALLVVLFGAGCDCGDDGDDVGGPSGSKTVIVEPGTGEPNNAPLFPVRVGYRGSIAENGVDLTTDMPFGGGAFHVPERVRWRERTLFRLEFQEPMRLTDVGYSEVTAEGALVTHLLNRGEPLARPLVAIPAEVRDGMIWEAWLDGTSPSFVSQARGGQIADTPFGPRRLWGIHTLYADGTSAGGTAYAEGIGRVGAIDPSGIITFFDRIVVPLEEPTDEVVTLPPAVALEPVTMLDGTPFSLAASQTLSLSALHHPGTEVTTLIHRREQYAASFCNNLFDPGRPDAVQECYFWTEGALEPAGAQGAPLTALAHGAEGCPRTDGSGIHPGAPLEGQWFIPRAALGQRDGRMTANSTGHDTPFRYVALFGAEGLTTPIRLETIQVNLDRSVYQDRMKFALTPIGAPVGAGTVLGDFFASRLRYYPAPITGSHDWATSRAIARAAGDALLQARDEMWVSITGITPDGPMPTVRPFGARLGNVSVESDANGQTALVHNRDGLIEELALDGNGGVTLRALGRADLPADHYVLGAVRAGGSDGSDDLVVFAGGPPYAECQVGLIPTITAWKGTAPAPAPARPPAVLDTVTATLAGLDLLVCWAPGAGEPELEGWTLGGEPARAIRAAIDGSCVLVLRDLATAADIDFGDASASLTRVGTFAAEGPIPGVGRVAIGVGRPSNEPLAALEDRTVGLAARQRDTDFVTLPEPIAALTGGGFVSHYALYGPGFHIEGAPRYGFVEAPPDGRGRPGIVDLGGNGLWVVSDDGITTIASLLSRDSQQFVIPGSHYVVPVAGGGLLLYSTVGRQGLAVTRLWPDGRMEDWSLDDVPLDPLYGVRLALADGTICGNGAGLVCVDPSGTQRVLPFEDPLLEALVSSLARFLVLPSGKIAILQEVWEQIGSPPAEVPTFVFDPVAMTVTLVDTRPVFQVSVGADGHVWGAVLDPVRDGLPVEITDTGFVEIELPFAQSSDDPLVAAFLRREIGFVMADQDVLVIWPRGRWSEAHPFQALSGRVLRVPRALP